MPHIHTGPGEHDHTASAIIIHNDGVVPKILLLMHKKLNRLLPPGGHVETNETPWQAVLHEITEESGYMPNQLKLLQPQQRIKLLDGTIVHPQPVVHATHGFANLNHNHTDLVYAFITDDLPRQKPAKGESTDLRWISKADLLNLSYNVVYKDTVQLCEYILTNVLGQWEVVSLSDYNNNK